jgi:hypothetical protein
MNNPFDSVPQDESAVGLQNDQQFLDDFDDDFDEDFAGETSEEVADFEAEYEGDFTSAPVTSYNTDAKK